MTNDIPNPAAHFIERHLREGRAHKVAIIDDAGRYTYEELARRVNRAGNALRAAGLQRGDRLLLCLVDGIDFVAMFWGALKIGVVPIAVNTFLSATDYEYILGDSDAPAIAISSQLLEQTAPALAGRDLNVLVAGHQPCPIPWLSFSDLANHASDELDARAVSPDEVGFWLYSSGSTGKPKAVMHRYSSPIHCAELFGRGVLGIREDDVIFSASKMFFAYGLGNSCFFPLHAGATAVLSASRPAPQSVLRMLSEHRATIFCGVPTLYAAILGNPDANLQSALYLRACTSAGEALPPAIASAWVERFGVEIIDGLGSSEALHIFISNRLGEIRRGTSGKPVPGYDVSIRAEDGREAGPDEIGDLLCRGPSIAAGYWNNDEAWHRASVDGWLRTGDKYFRDADGYYHYAGRSDDMLKVGGIWVSPAEVESALMEHALVLEAAVVGAADSDGLIKPKAFVVLKNKAGASEAVAEELRLFVRKSLAPYKYPRWIEFRNELPKTATGKIRRRELRGK